MSEAEFFEKLVLDEDIPVQIGYMLEGRELNVLHHEAGASDSEVLGFAVENNAPLLTKDEDFREKSDENDHFGILIDNHMHVREWSLVADTVKEMLENIPRKSFRNNVWRISDYYGVF